MTMWLTVYAPTKMHAGEEAVSLSLLPRLIGMALEEKFNNLQGWQIAST